MKVIEIKYKGFTTIMDADKVLMIERRDEVTNKDDVTNFTVYFPNMKAALTEETYQEISEYMRKKNQK